METISLSKYPKAADIKNICQIENKAVRNLQITYCYYLLSQAMQIRTDQYANWCTFATWASRQAGKTIRGEDFLESLERKLGKKAFYMEPLQSVNRWLLKKGLFEPQTTLGRIVKEIHTPFDAFEKASEAVADGNLKVFAEIAEQFALFLQSVPNATKINSPGMELFLNGFEQGMPPAGQDYLKQAFLHYQKIQSETDPVIKVSLVLLANLKIGLHEQSRLQDQIKKAIDAPSETFTDLGKRVLNIIVPGSKLWPKFVNLPVVFPLHWLAKKVQTALQKITHEVITETMMVLEMPGSVLALGKNLDKTFPDTFKEISLPELREFLDKYDPCPDGKGNCAAENWTDLRQRMHYIIHLFKAYADDTSIFSAPFSKKQVALIEKGIIPDGKL
ncbi:MAG: hypothetical protein H6627_06305 [Calditrichae bacterium]|nr:hypothetical protein [Calditrichia bacterium]